MRTATLHLVLAALACGSLAAPAVRAGTPATASPPPAAGAPAMCPAREAQATVASSEALLRLQQRLQAEADAVGAEAPVVLNGRGYNYRTAQDPLRELKILELERARAKARQP